MNEITLNFGEQNFIEVARMLLFLQSNREVLNTICTVAGTDGSVTLRVGDVE